MKIENRLKNIVNEWFYSEPLLFLAACSHQILENTQMNVPMRSGRLRIEFNPGLLENCSDNELSEYLKIEVFRILLQHPYRREPYNANKNILLIASDLTINQFYKTNIRLEGAEYLKSLTKRFKELENPLGEEWAGTEEEKFFMRNLNIDRQTGRFYSCDNLSFEDWYKWILFLVKHISTEGQNAGNSSLAEKTDFATDAADLWEENEEAQENIQKNIQKVEIDQGWGELGGGLKREIQSQADFSMDYRRALSQFRQNIVSATRNLTRMKPSRRFGFKAMGSRYQRKANVLIAVDVSGSITDESFNRFFHAINNIFFLGIIEKIDVIFFDTTLKFSKPVSIKKKLSLKEIQGRGGTNFQCAVDFFASHKEYNGLIIFTDGQGNPPLMRSSQNVLWILTTRIDYENSRSWINSLPGNKATYMPF